MTTHKTTIRGAFTLIELLVVIAIIGVLISVLLPAFSAIRDQAKVTDCQASLKAIETGLELFRSESALGSAYPPSAGDNIDPGNADLRWYIRIPQSLVDRDDDTMVVSGAHLLYQALVGADGLGTPGFKDIDRDGTWWDDTFRGEGGAYEVDQATGVPVQPRYGGGSYVEEGLRSKRTTTLKTLMDSRGATWVSSQDADKPTSEQPFFVDPWDRPILYYRANKAATLMCGSDAEAEPGVYRQEDNAIITGSDSGQLGKAGIDFGAGELSANVFHGISRVAYPAAVEPGTASLNPILTENVYDYTFARFIFDPSVKGRNTPVRRDSYLLITAGKDGWYGTDDDVVNWSKEK